MAKPRLMLLGASFFLIVLFFSASQFRPSLPTGEGQASWKEYREYFLNSLRTSSQKDSFNEHSEIAQAEQNAKSSAISKAPTHTPTQAPSKPAKPTQQPAPKVQSQAAQAASNAAMKLQYVLNSTDANFVEELHLYTMGKYINTFTTYLEALLSEPTLDREPFRKLREQFFPWWSPSANHAYLPWQPSNKAKTGIVLTAGQGNFVLAAHCVQILRNVLESSLPIQVFHAGDMDLPEAYRDHLKTAHPNLETVDILSGQFNETLTGIGNSGYAMKPFAALASSFERVILVDADTIFLQRPDAYFDEHPGLNETGIHYFHDRAYGGRKTTDWIKELMRSAEPSPVLKDSLYWQEELEHQQESGVVMYNKAIPSAFMSLLFTAYINTQKIRDHVYGQVAGDKETYWLASELASAPYTFQPTYAGMIGNLDLPYPLPSPSPSPSNPTKRDDDADKPQDTESNTHDFKLLPAPTDAIEMCSAQPLHLTHHNTPFWFNSGLRLEKEIDSRQYVNLTHWLPGAATSMDNQFEWRFRSHHTFCTTAEAREWRSLEEVGLKGVVERSVEEAKRVDLRFLGHEGGVHDDPEGGKPAGSER